MFPRHAEFAYTMDYYVPIITISSHYVSVTKGPHLWKSLYREYISWMLWIAHAVIRLGRLVLTLYAHGFVYRYWYARITESYMLCDTLFFL